MRYLNATGRARRVVVSRSPERWERVGAGEVVVIDDPAVIEGLEGQEAIWEPLSDSHPDAGDTGSVPNPEEGDES